MHKCERIRSLPSKEKLEKAWRIPKEPSLEWDESVLGEKIEKYRERDRRKWFPDRTEGLYSAASKSRQMQVSRGIEVYVEEVSRKSSLTVEVSRNNTSESRTEARSIHQVSRCYLGYRPNLDQSTKYRGAVIRKSLGISTNN